MAVTDTMDQDLVNTMTPEELAAINDPDAGAGALAAIAAGADDGPDDGGDDDDDAPADPALADAAPAPAPAQAAAPAVPAEPAAAAVAAPAPGADGAVLDAAAAPAPAGEPLPEVGGAAPAPVYDFQLPGDFAQRQEALKTATAELRERRKQGDVSNEEYDAEIDRLGDERRELDRLQTRADVATDMQRQHEVTQRTTVANSVMESASKAGLDYTADEEKFAELRATMDALQRIESHRAKGFEHVIREADRRVRLAHGIGTTAPAPTPAAPVPAKTAAEIKAEANKARAPDLSAAPVTLAQVPGGDGPGDVGGEFEDVMSLEGEAYEDAIANLAKNPQRFARFQAAKH